MLQRVDNIARECFEAIIAIFEHFFPGLVFHGEIQPPDDGFDQHESHGLAHEHAGPGVDESVATKVKVESALHEGEETQKNGTISFKITET